MHTEFKSSRLIINFNFNLKNIIRSKHTRIMPDNYKHTLFFSLLLAQLMVIVFVFSSIAPAYEGIAAYYTRYDVKSSSNKIIDDNLLMVPAKNDFRAKKFSQISTTGTISASHGESKVSINKRIKNNSLKSILTRHGLKSVKTKDYDTVISYEGVIITPLNILKKTYHKDQQTYLYETKVMFSPIAFPDKWAMLNIKFKIKKVFNNFFQLFK